MIIILRMAIRSDWIRFGKIQIKTQFFFTVPESDPNPKISEYPNPIQWISDRFRIYAKPENILN